MFCQLSDRHLVDIVTIGQMISVDRAGAADVAAVVDLQIALFREDAGVHEALVDLSWPVREGRRDIEHLLALPDAVVLVARDSPDAIGFLVGYLSQASASRVPHSYAVLRSLYAVASHRRRRAAGLLVQEFLSWARERGCVEARVDSYAANDPAQRFYERLGFAARSVTRVHTF